jgi:hypothetical protein
MTDVNHQHLAQIMTRKKERRKERINNKENPWSCGLHCSGGRQMKK